MPTADRACLPRSPRISISRSDAPFITAGCSSKPGAELTMPSTLTIRVILSRSPISAFTLARQFSMTSRAAWYPASMSRSRPSLPMSVNWPSRIGPCPDTKTRAPVRTVDTYAATGPGGGGNCRPRASSFSSTRGMAAPSARDVACAAGRPAPARPGPGARRLRDSGVQAGAHDHALLLVGIGARAHEHGRRVLAAVDRDVRHARRDVEVVTGTGDRLLAEIVAGPQFHLLPAHEEERGLVMVMHVSPGAPAGRDHHRANPQACGADRLGAHTRRVVQALLARVRAARWYDPARFRPLAS